MTKKFDCRELIRFLVVGFLNTLLSYAVFSLAISQGCNHWTANFLALVFGIVLGFRAGGVLVFRNPDGRLWRRFFLAWMVIYVLISGLIGLLINFGINAYISGIIVLPFSAALSFVAQKYFVFGFKF